MNEINTAKFQDASISFLENDFNQCFEQVRYYDTQIVDIFKFLATFYTTVAGIAIGLYQLSIEKHLALTPGLISGLSVAFLFGVCMFFLIVRNRVYFVFCMRYVNEQRGFFLSCKPVGFENNSKMYTDYKKPPFFNVLSSQSWWLYVVGLLNSVLLGVILYIAKMSCGIITITCAIVLLGQLISGIAYLKSRENKSAAEAVFGK